MTLNGRACSGVAQEENGGAGVYSADLRKQYLLQDESWKYDIMPEIVNGHNVMDFVDPDIEARLEALEREEEELSLSHAVQVGSQPHFFLYKSRIGMCRQC
jgi:NOGCT (NUC087) domain